MKKTPGSCFTLSMVHWFPDFQLVPLSGAGFLFLPANQPNRFQDGPNFRTLPASIPSRVTSPSSWFFKQMIRPSSEGTESLGIPGLGSILCRAAGLPIVPAGRHDCARMVAYS